MPSLSMVKNSMRRAVRELLVPPLTDVQKNTLWAFFGSCCAYCGKALSRERRDGHLDHADPFAGNHPGNLILACNICNGDEKREQHWESFLKIKCQDAATVEARREKILAWQRANPTPQPTPDPARDAAIERTEEAIAQFEEAFKALRSIVKNSTR